VKQEKVDKARQRNTTIKERRGKKARGKQKRSHFNGATKSHKIGAPVFLS